MSRLLFLPVLLLSLTFATVARSQSTAAHKFDDQAVDPAANPCSDFYQYACGGWLARNPIPPDRSHWSIAQQMSASNDDRVAALLAEAARTEHSRSPDQQKFGDYFASCMDLDTIEASGLKPLQAELDKISDMASLPALAERVAQLHRFGSDALFAFYPDSRLEDAAKVIAQIDQSGLSLPEPGFYTEDSSEMQQTRTAYRAHLETIFKLLGESEARSRTSAEEVLGIETVLSKAELTPLERRDRQSYYHVMTAADLQNITPEFHWSRYFAVIGISPRGEMNVAVPKYMQTIDTLLKTTPLSAWKSYLQWQLVRQATPALPARFRAAHFKFFREYLDGAKEESARSTQCAQLTNRDLGDAVAQEYVRRYFPPTTKAKMLTMADSIRAAMREDFEQISWLSPETRKEALSKLQLLRIMLGYPDHWRDYTKLEIKRGDAAGNALRAQEAEFRRQLGKIGKPVDRTEFYELPQGLDGYHDNPLNVVVFTAGILQPPFFDPEMDDAVNFGWAGAVIGHELTHAFDDKGHLFDGIGNLRNWWTEADTRNYNERAACFVRQYSSYPVTKDVNVNGELTLGENIADNGGLRLAYEAFVKTNPDHTQKIAGHALLQRFFLAWAQWRCTNITDQKARQFARTDGHSPGRWRVNGVVSNMPGFAQAYGCKSGDPMVKADACRVW